MAEALGDPAVDPHGDPIPDRRLSLRADEGVSLAELEAGEGGVLGRVSDSDPEMLRYLDERGIRPGVRITVSEREPFGRGIVVELSGGDRHPIGEALARRMVVG
jgi:DtxR family Mn-dependent transcriptional regulator